MDCDLQELVARGELRRTDMVWSEGQNEWRTASTLDGIDWTVAPPPPPGMQVVPATGGPMVCPQQSGKAVASMICSILGFMFCPLLFHILGLSLGYSARSEIAASRGTLTGGQMATAGIVMGWIGIGLILAGVLLYVLFFGVLFGAAAAF